MSLETFRAETRAWLEENCPAEMRLPLENDEAEYVGGRNATFASEAQKIWFERCRDKGWTVPHWPTEYGGGGLDKAEAKILREEMAAIGARRPLTSFGIDMLGPALLKFGSEEQKKEHLTKITAGEIRWAQGYSEPNAGSDLASLMTKCEDKGDHYLINGQKIWTSYGDLGDMIFVLVRTDFEAKKHEGISFVLVDMDQPGVEARPIKLISGKSPFCETFFSDVKVPKDQLVGDLNAGWTIAKRLLQFERSSISAGGFGGTGGSGILPPQEYAKQHVGVDETGRVADGDLRARITDHLMYAKAFGLTVQRSTEEAKAGQEVGHTASIMKYAAAKMNQDKCELLVEALGTDGLGWDGDGFAEDAKKATRGWLRSKGNSIEGGTSEINLNVVAKRVLGLREHQ